MRNLNFTALATDVLLIFFWVNFICCHKEETPHPIVGTWQTIVPTYPAKYFSFNENGSACHKLDSTDFKSENCNLKYLIYKGQADTLALFQEHGSTALWEISFHGENLLKARHLTPNPIVTPVHYLERIDD